MDRRLLFPLAAVTAWAQQPSPEAVAAEAALRGRVSEFFQDQVDKKFRQAEALVADDTKDLYYGGNKFNIKSFTISRVELLENNSKAKVGIKAKVTFMLPSGPPIDVEAPQDTLWKMENGQWMWYLETHVETPFGTINPPADAGTVTPPAKREGAAPDIATLQSMVKLDRDAVVLTQEEPRQTITVSNDLPGAVDLDFDSKPPQGFSVEIEKKHLEAGEKTPVHMAAQDGGSNSGVVRILVSPLNSLLEIQVAKK